MNRMKLIILVLLFAFYYRSITSRMGKEEGTAEGNSKLAP
jgi:hypothetical protein